jgi:hypothetical protein
LALKIQATPKSTRATISGCFRLIGGAINVVANFDGLPSGSGLISHAESRFENTMEFNGIEITGLMVVDAVRSIIIGPTKTCRIRS